MAAAHATDCCGGRLHELAIDDVLMPVVTFPNILGVRGLGF